MSEHHEETRVACEECDLLVRLPDVETHSKLSCPRCGNTLAITGVERMMHALPLAICAAILLALSLQFPFMSFERAGVSNQMTLLQTSIALFRDDSPVLAGLVMLFIIITPLVLVISILLVSITFYTRRWVPGVKGAARLVFTITSWNMAEVFIIGVFVSLVKIAKMASIGLGVSLWAYLALALALVGAIASLDKVGVWNHISRLERQRG